MRASSMVWLSLFAIVLAGCGSSEPSTPVSSSPVVQSPIALNDVPATSVAESHNDPPADAALVTLELPGMV